MTVLVEAVVFGLSVAFMLVGLVGIIIPILPGMLLIWLSVLAFAVVEGFKSVDWITFSILTAIALVVGTADIWMSLLGAKTGGASGRSMIFGAAGSILGFIFLGPLFPPLGSLFGGAIGYAAGVLLGQYHKYRDWRMAAKAAVGGLAGWGVSTAIQLGGGILIIALFIWQVLKY
jgi:uncharacterized protein YqgC (DUF456 family)